MREMRLRLRTKTKRLKEAQNLLRLTLGSSYNIYRVREVGFSPKNNKQIKAKRSGLV